MSLFHNFLWATGFVLGQRLTPDALYWVMSMEAWQIQARGGSGVELPIAVGLIQDVTCSFHPPTTTTNVLKLIQALQGIFSLVHKRCGHLSVTCLRLSSCRKKEFETSNISSFLLRALLVVLNEIRQRDLSRVYFHLITAF